MEWVNHAFYIFVFFNILYVDVHDGRSIIQMSLRRDLPYQLTRKNKYLQNLLVYLTV